MSDVDFHNESSYRAQEFELEKTSLMYRIVFKTGIIENISQARIVLVIFSILIFSIAFIVFPYGGNESISEPDLGVPQDPFEPLY
ncbi:hypothetical protein COB55_00080 [Candidatus Wolfebacteria bacterium]|nr:MAG: hypothetical protein COB55_00080 [Candidatus Wolfebacteria bacterium]